MRLQLPDRAADWNSGEAQVGTEPNGISFDGANIWVANSGSNSVVKLLPATGASIGAFATGPNPSPLAFDGSSIWAASVTNGKLTQIRAVK